jgi:hypothetical protein
VAFRPYHPARSPAALFDRAVHLFGRSPAFWLGRGLLPSLPVALLAFAFVHLHQSVWSYQAWDVALTLQSWLLAGLVVIAWGFRNFAQPGLFREALVQAKEEMGITGDASSSPLATVRRRSCGGAMVVLGGSLMLLPFFLLPGALFLASTLTLGPLIASEDRDLGSALHRCLRLARARPLWGAMTLLFFAVVHLLLWLSVLLSCGGALALLSALSGVDLSAAEIVLSPENPSFLLGSGIFAWLLLEPLWLLQRTLLYLDSVLGSSGADLRTTWDAIKVAESTGRRRAEGGRPAPGAGPLVGLGGLLLLTIASVTPAAAQTLPAGDSEQQLLSYAAHLETLADAVDALILTGDVGDLSPPEEAAPLKLLQRTLESDGSTTLLLPSGLSIQVDLRPGLPPREDEVSIQEAADTLLALAVRLRASSDFARALASPGGPPPQPSPDLHELLAEELLSAEYSLTVRTREDRGEGVPLLQRFFEWLEEWLEGHKPPVTQPPPGASLHLPTKLVVGVALGLFAIFALILGGVVRRSGDGPKTPGGAALPSPSSQVLPDARSRTVASWVAMAEASARAGEYREAIRSLFLAVLAQLEGVREIEYRPSASNGEHLSTFSGPSPRRDRFVLAVFSFELAWFGGNPAQEGDWDRMFAHCTLLLGIEETGGDARA